MKRLLSPLLALVALGYLGAMYYTGALPERGQRVKFVATGLLRDAPQQVDTVVLTVPPAPPRTFTRVAGGWQENGKPLAPKVVAHLDKALTYMHNSGPVRTMPLSELKGQDPKEFGMAPPRFTLRLQRQGVAVLDAGFGGTNADGVLNYVGVMGGSDLYMLSHFIIAEWDKVSAP